MEKGEDKQPLKKTYDANLNLYSSMAHYVGKKLHIRPNEILDHWGVSELIVTYGVYRNEDQRKYFYQIEEHNKQKGVKKISLPPKYIVYFYTREEYAEELKERKK